MTTFMHGVIATGTRYQAQSVGEKQGKHRCQVSHAWITTWQFRTSRYARSERLPGRTSVYFS